MSRAGLALALVLSGYLAGTMQPHAAASDPFSGVERELREIRQELTRIRQTLTSSSRKDCR